MILWTLSHTALILCLWVVKFRVKATPARLPLEYHHPASAQYRASLRLRSGFSFRESMIERKFFTEGKRVLLLRSLFPLSVLFTVSVFCFVQRQENELKKKRHELLEQDLRLSAWRRAQLGLPPENLHAGSKNS